MKKNWLKIRPQVLWLFAAAILMMVGLVLLSLAGADRGDDPTAGAPRLEVREVQDPEHAADDYDIRVPDERIPQTMDERVLAAPLEILPNHTGFPEAGGETALPEEELKEIKQSAEDFLAVWETYLPSDGYRDRYEKRLAPLVYPPSLPAVISRRDAIDAASVCPEVTCRLGSKWWPRTPSLFVIDHSANRVYVTGYGAITYQGDRSISSQAAASSERSYGLIMRRSPGGWLIERIAAESLR